MNVWKLLSLLFIAISAVSVGAAAYYQSLYANEASKNSDLKATINGLNATISSVKSQLLALQTELNSNHTKIFDRGLSFLSEYLWNSSVGAYRESPTFTGSNTSLNYWPQDNYLAYIFNTESVVNQTKAGQLHQFLLSNNLTYYNRWVVLSKYPANYTRYPCATCVQKTPYNNNGFADNVALDGIYDFKTGNLTGARERFNFLISHMLDQRLGLLRDNATGGEGFVYYKVSLALILASELSNSTYTTQFSETLAAAQNLDGSWLTGPARPGGVFPNTEGTILDLIALKLAWNL